MYSIYTDANLQLKRWDEAERYLNKQDSILRGAYPFYGERAQILTGRKQYAEALEMADKNLQTATSPNYINYARETKMHILMLLGRTDEAWTLYSDIIAARDSSYNERVNASLDEIRTQYETEKHIAEKERNYNYFLFAAGMCLLLALALGIWIAYSRSILKKNRALYLQIKEQDKLKTEIAAIGIIVDNDKGTPRQRELVARLRDYLLTDRNFTRSGIDHEEIISTLVTNRTTLAEAVKAVSGLTVQEYINRMRIEEAKLLLETSHSTTIEGIAEACGFATDRTFYRLFRNAYGLTPAAYRRAAMQ
jgi:AraC-like DNA-binding protein